MVGSRKKKQQQNEILYGISLLLLIIFILGILGYFYINRNIEDQTIDLCPRNTELIAGHTIFLIDSTDKLTSRQEDAIEVNFFNHIRNLPEYHLVSVFALTNDLESGRKPVISLCTPKKFDKKRDSEFTNSKAFIENRFVKNFKAPIDEKLKGLINKETADSSPIFEMLQLVKIDGFDRRPIGINAPQRLVIYSDMLHHTKEFSQYKTSTTGFQHFISSSYGMKVVPNLKGINVEINLLMNRPELQSAPLIDFWRELVKNRGGSIGSIEHFPG